jgi:mannose-6-phosphate isomerase-like protein (cupin superfamily)
VPDGTGSPAEAKRSKAKLRKFKAPLCEGVNFEQPIFTGGLADAPFGVKRCIVDVGSSLPLDRHAERELWVVIQGHGELTYKGETSEIGEGDMVAFDPDVPHEFSNTADVPFELVSVYWASQRSAGQQS